MNKNLFEVRHPIFRPAWRRALVTGVCLGWAAFEFSNGAQLWALLFGICGVYLFIQFFLRFDPDDYEDAPSDKDTK